MRIAKPSPALVISLLALVFAMTGTGIAAKSVIDGKNIKKGSITADKLADGAVTPRKLSSSVVPKGYAFLVVKRPTGKQARARASSMASSAYITPKLCPDGTIIFGGYDCPAPSPATSVPVPGPKGDTGTNGTDGADPGVAGTMRATIPAEPDGALVRFGAYLASPVGLGTVSKVTGDAQTAFNAAASVAPSGAATEISDVYFEVFPNGGKMPKGATVIMYVDGQSTESQNTAKCAIEDLSVTTHCSFKGPVTIPAGAKFAWDFLVLGGQGGQGWDAFDISAAYRSTVAP